MQLEKKIKTLLVDDEPLARRNLRLLLQHDQQIEIVGECANGEEAVNAIEASSPDLIFLDIQMPGMSGFDVLEAVGADRIHAIVFVTAFDQFALRAFEVHALDYLLKPFDDARFQQALQQAKSQIEQRQVSKLTSKLLALLDSRESDRRLQGHRKYLHRLMIKLPNRVILLKVNDIDWIEADGNYAKLHLGTKSHLLRQKMNELEELLDPNRFVRTHRSIIVNLDRVKELHPHFNGDYLIGLQDGTRVKLSRSRREALEARLRTVL